MNLKSSYGRVSTIILLAVYLVFAPFAQAAVAANNLILTQRNAGNTDNTPRYLTNTAKAVIGFNDAGVPVPRPMLVDDSGNVTGVASLVGGGVGPFKLQNGIWLGTDSATAPTSRKVDLMGYDALVSLANSIGIVWESTATITATKSVGLFYDSDGVLQINNGTPGTFRDLKLRDLTASGSVTASTLFSNNQWQQIGGGNLFFLSSGVLRVVNSASSAGVVLDVSTDGTLKLRNKDNSADAALTALSVTIGGGTPIAKVLSATATLDFPSTIAGAVADLTITVTGATTASTVSIGAPNGSVTATATFSAWVSAADTVTVRFSPKATEDPASGSFRATVMNF